MNCVDVFDESNRHGVPLVIREGVWKNVHPGFIHHRVDVVVIFPVLDSQDRMNASNGYPTEYALLGI